MALRTNRLSRSRLHENALVNPDQPMPGVMVPLPCLVIVPSKVPILTASPSVEVTSLSKPLWKKSNLGGLPPA
jgi:hypothetical protein